MTNRRECRLVTSTPVLHVGLLVYCVTSFFTALTSQKPKCELIKQKDVSELARDKMPLALPPSIPFTRFFSYIVIDLKQGFGGSAATHI